MVHVGTELFNFLYLAKIKNILKNHTFSNFARYGKLHNSVPRHIKNILFLYPCIFSVFFLYFFCTFSVCKFFIGTPTIREKVNKKIQFGAAMSLAKMTIQIAITENVTAELIGILTQFIMKYRRSTGLSIENTENAVTFSGTKHHISMV
jgi:hypothetical protein